MNQLFKDSIEGNKVSQLRQAFDCTFAMPSSLASSEFQDLLTIRIAGDPYAIRLFDITEIISEQRVFSVPSVTPNLLGLVGIRGRILPVFSLSSMLGYGTDLDSPRWMILCGSEEPIALAFSDFDGYLRLPSSSLHADENFRATYEHVKYVNQVASTPDGARPVISIPLIMATIRNQISQHRPTKES